MSTATLVSVEDYLASGVKPTPEYREGILRPRSMPSLLHSLVQHFLVVLLRQMGLAAFQELTVRLSGTRYLVPDIVVAERFEGDYPSTPPEICIEILSPGDRPGGTLAKCEEYHAWGVPYCWVIDPVAAVAWEYHKGQGPVHVDRSGTLHAGAVGVQMDELFRLVEAERRRGIA